VTLFAFPHFATPETKRGLTVVAAMIVKAGIQRGEAMCITKC
jgi:hypothetical protein